MRFLRFATLFAVIFLVGCSNSFEQSGTCSTNQTNADINITPSPRTVSSGKVAQYFFIGQQLKLKRVMIKAITNGLTSMTIKIGKGSPYSSLQTAEILSTFTTTTGLTSASLQEVWFDLPTPIDLPPLNNGSDNYVVFFEGTGSITVDYSATTAVQNFRWEYREYNGAFWEGDNQDTEGISVGIAGEVDCSL